MNKDEGSGVQSAEKKRYMHQEPEPPSSKIRESLDSFIHISSHKLQPAGNLGLEKPCASSPTPRSSFIPSGMIVWKSSLIEGRGKDRIGLRAGLFENGKLNLQHRGRGRQICPHHSSSPFPPFTPATPSHVRVRALFRKTSIPTRITDVFPMLET